MAPSSVVLYPCPGIGHLVSMVELGKLIHTHHPSLSVVILITPFEIGSTDKYIRKVSAIAPSITFYHLPTIALPPYSSTHFIDIAFEIPELYKPIVHDTLVSISEKSTIKAVVLDFFSNAAFDVARGLNFPTYYFYTSSASGLCVFLHLPTIHHLTAKSFKELNTYIDITGVPPIHASNMPAAFDRDSNTCSKFIDTANNMARSSGVIVNSFHELQQRAVDSLRDRSTPPVYLIGPLIASVDQAEHECLKWLSLQPSKSVVFLCFGSRGVFKKEQLQEIAIGLEKSGQRFLWVVQSEGSSFDELFPRGFLGRTGDKGLVVRDWAPQRAILGHESVGGFVSHGGWNSALEALVAGVPMVVWPLYAEQKLNRVFLVEEMKVGLAVEIAADGFVTAEAVAEKVRELMEGERGRAVRKEVLEISGRAMAAVEEGGSSRVEFSKVIQSWTAI